MELYFQEYNDSDDVSVKMNMIPCSSLPTESKLSVNDKKFLSDMYSYVDSMYDEATVLNKEFCVNKTKLNELNENFAFSYASIYMYPCDPSETQC